MKVYTTFTAIALCVILSILIEQSYSYPRGANDELNLISGIHGILDCPNNCWGNESTLNLCLEIVDHWNH